MALITKHCPHCGTLINYDDSEKNVCCLGCDRMLSTEELRSNLDTVALEDKKGGVADQTASLASFLVQSIETAESGLAYLENFFENYDWIEFYYDTRLSVGNIDRMVEKNKVKNANNPSTWILEFKSLVFPVNKKIEGCQYLEQAIVDNYDFEENTEVFTYYDSYKKVVNSLISNKSSILKTLFNDIKYAERYGADEEDIKQMKVELAELNEAFSTLTPIDSLEEIPAVAELIKEKEQEIANELLAKGIDAPSVYEAAVQGYMFDTDKSECLRKFVSIRKYKDSEKYIKRINRLFKFNGKLYDIAGKTYITKIKPKTDLNPTTVNVKSNGSEQQEEQNLSSSFGLYEVIDGIPADKPILSGITAIYCVYASNIYFVKNDRMVCSFNTVTKSTTKLDSGDLGCYKDKDGEYYFYYNKERDKIFFKKTLKAQIENPGCWASLFGKKQEIIPNRNNFSLISIDIKENKLRTIVPELVDIEYVSGNKVFYTYVIDRKDEYETFMVYDFDKKDSDRVLEFGCKIHKVIGEKVVYSELNPSSYNLDLYVYDLESGTSLLLENNIVDFFEVIQDKVFYKVGNDDYCPLFSINLDGTERTEIMQHVEKICHVRAGWMYINKRRYGYDNNSILMKISADGTKRVVLTYDFKEFIKFENGYIYYRDKYNDLCIIRNDGEEYRTIAEDVYGDPIIDSDIIYFTRKEEVGNNRNSLSLYSMDLYGHNLRKLEFDITAMTEYDESTIYFDKKEVVRYEITTPINAKETNKTIKIFNIDRIYAYDKNTGEKKVVLTIGLPRPGEFEFRSGCFGKKVSHAEETYVEMPIRHKYVRPNRVKAGTNHTNQVVQNNANNASNQPGCLGTQGASNNNGCSSNKGCLNQNK